MIEVFLQTGMRLSELANLTLKDVELPKRITRDIDSMGSVRVLRKGGKVEQILLNYKACHALATYLKVRPKVEHTGLFVTKFKTQMTARAVEYMVHKYLVECEIHHASVHTLRHYEGDAPCRERNGYQDGAGDAWTRESGDDEHLCVALQAWAEEGAARARVVT